jgi:hypothetical protein
VRKRFKEHEEILMQLLQTDPEFQELCEDYEICMQATDYWSDKGIPGAQEKAKEFRIITLDLEAEICKKLNDHKSLIR